MVNQLALWVFSYIPKDPKHSFTVSTFEEQDRHLTPEEVKSAIPEIEKFTLTKIKNVTLNINGLFSKVTINGFDPDADDIFQFQTVKGNRPFDYSGLDMSKKYGWVGEQLFSKMGDTTSITIDDQEYEIAGVMYNRQLANDIFIDADSYLKHFPTADRYTFSVKPELVKSLTEEDIFLLFQKKLALTNPVLGLDWTDYEEHNQTTFGSLLSALFIIAFFVIFYGVINILTIMINKNESQREQTRIQCSLGIKKSQLYFQEFFTLFIIVVVAAVFDFIFLALLKDLLATYLNVYIEISPFVFGISLLLALFISQIISYIVFKLRIKNYS